MQPYPKNPVLKNDLLPVEFVLHPSWWYKHAGIEFDQDFFFHPIKRVEAERRMEQVLFERFGRYGFGQDHNRDLPIIGAIHNAAGFFVSEILGCEVRYRVDAAPEVVPAGFPRLNIDVDRPFHSRAMQRLVALQDNLKRRFGFLLGDINWGGVLNIAIDLRGQDVFLDMIDEPERTKAELKKIATVIERFVTGIEAETGTSSISVNRTVRLIRPAVFLHSECSHTMISVQHYEEFILPIDIEWSLRHRPFGIHHCGRDAHRFAASYAKIPHLDFLDVGWGSDVSILRQYLPTTFLNLRLDSVSMSQWTPEEIRGTVRRLVYASGNPWLTGICCINMDHTVTDEQICAMLDAVVELRQEYKAMLVSKQGWTG